MFIVYAVDKKYAPYVLPQLSQLKQVSAQIKGIKVVVNQDVPEKMRDLIRATAKMYDHKLEIVETNKLKNLYDKKLIKSRTHVSYFTYVKLFLPEILPTTDQILYLDVDILIRKPIEDLLRWKLTHPIAAVAEFGRNGQSIFGTSHVSYFNAGVLRMSLSRCREMSLTAKAKKLIQMDIDFEFQDQDIFNSIFRNKFDHLSPYFNVFHSDAISSKGIAAFKDPVIVHFNGPEKPWMMEVNSLYANDWRKTYFVTHKSKNVLNQKSFSYSVAEPTLAISAKEQSESTAFNKLMIFSRMSNWLISVRDAQIRKFASAITFFRRSTFGVWVRSILPYSVKKKLNDFVYLIYKKSPTVKDDLDSALFERLVDLKNFDKKVPISQSKKRFIFVVSAPRSGTTAFLDLFTKSSTKFINGNELFRGYGNVELTKIISDEFLWFGDLRKTKKSSPKMFEVYQNKMNLAAESILQLILDTDAFQKKVFVVKIFHDHLSKEALEVVLKNYASHVIFLRRRMLYSYISKLKALATNKWINKDTSSQRVFLDERFLSEYVQDTEKWFYETQQLTRTLSIPVLELTYEELFESKNYPVSLKKFIKNLDRTVTIFDNSTARTVIQDRRQDGFLSEIQLQFSSISPELRERALRFPGLP